MKSPNFLNITRDQILQRVGHMDQVAGIRAYEATEGKARASRALDVYTGSGLTFTVLPDRALDISACHFRGVSLAWTSPVGNAHPAFYEPEEDGWLRNFPGGLLVTGGLDQYGNPSIDEGESFGLHGRVSNTPASHVNTSTSWKNDRYELEISGEVRQARVYGENLVLRRCITTHLGSNKIRLEDVVTNEGYAPQPHMILYHFNTGYPLLDETSHLEVKVDKTLPQDSEAESGLGNWMNFQVPTQGYQQQVFHHKPAADRDGKVKIELLNPTLNLGLRWTYLHASLPDLFQWKQMGQGIYVLGVEPSNCSGMGGRAAARASGDLPFLKAGESCRYEIELEVFEWNNPQEK